MKKPKIVPCNGDAVVVRRRYGLVYGVVESEDAYGLHIADPISSLGYLLACPTFTICVRAKDVQRIITADELNQARSEWGHTRPPASIGMTLASLPQE